MKLEVKYPENCQLRLSERITMDINQRLRSPTDIIPKAWIKSWLSRYWQKLEKEAGRYWKRYLGPVNFKNLGTLASLKLDIGHRASYLQHNLVPGVTCDVTYYVKRDNRT